MHLLQKKNVLNKDKNEFSSENKDLYIGNIGLNLGKNELNLEIKDLN